MRKVRLSRTNLELTKWGPGGARFVKSIFELIRSNLVSDEQVKIAGFGLFEVKAKKVRRGRNPQTGEQLEISGRKV